MLATNNIFSPASGRPVIYSFSGYYSWELTTSLGHRFALRRKLRSRGHLPLFENTTEVEFAIANRKLDYHQYIRLRNPDQAKILSLVTSETRSSKRLQVVFASTRSGLMALGFHQQQRWQVADWRYHLALLPSCGRQGYGANHGPAQRRSDSQKQLVQVAQLVSLTW